VGLSAERAPALYLETARVELRCAGSADPQAVTAAEAAFAARTGWQLSIRAPGLERETQAATPAEDSFAPPPGAHPSELNFALSTARAWFGAESSCYKASADQAALTVTLRFHFPDAARALHAAQLAELAAYIGWTVRLWPQPHQEALMRAAREALPAGLSAVGAPALRAASREVELRVQGEASPEELEEAAAAFAARTGWRLSVRR
jgi:uncharacterized protein